MTTHPQGSLQPSAPSVPGRLFEKTLYLYGSGKLRFWTIRYDEKTGLIERSYGIVDGKVVNPKPVQIGDAKKAMTKVRAEIKKKMLLGFGEKANRGVQRGSVFGPMGAHKLDEYSHKIRYPACVQRKYDGFRCLANVSEGTLHSKSMKAFPHLQHIKEAIQKAGFPEGVWLDGELYSHGLRLNEISSIVMKKRELSDEEKRNEKKIVYVIFDMVFPGSGFGSGSGSGSEMGFAERFAHLQKKKSKIKGPLELATCQEVGSKAEIDRLHEKYLLDGYEGVIVRNLDGLYLYKKKSYDVLRTKEFKHGVFEIVGAKEGVGAHDGAIVWELGCGGGGGGKTFSAMQIGALGERRALYQKYKKNPKAFLGRKVRVKHLGVGANGCVLRNPVVEGFLTTP